MKAIVIPAVFLISMPALAAKVKDATCSDAAQIQDVVTPQYLAVIDGYNKAGKKVDEEIDMGDIVTESKQVSSKCAQDKTAKLDAVREQLKKTSAPAASATAMNPVKATCEDFVALGEEVQPVAAFWVAGHNKSGILKNGTVDEEFLERPITTLIEDCKAHPTASFYNKAKAWLKKRA